MRRAERIIRAGIFPQSEAHKSGIALIIFDKKYSGVVSVHKIPGVSA